MRALIIIVVPTPSPPPPTPIGQIRKLYISFDAKVIILYSNYVYHKPEKRMKVQYIEGTFFTVQLNGNYCMFLV